MTSSTPLIEHIGILVPDLEEAIARWHAATGYEFSPIARYRTSNYIDHSDAERHFHDARISFSNQGSPRIELMEVTGAGTHGPAQQGLHHLGFTGVPDCAGRMGELAQLGIGEDGRAVTDEGEILLCFTRKEDLDGVRLEFVSPLPGPTVADDGGALWVDPETGRNSVWGPGGATEIDPAALPPVHHIGILVPDLDEAIERWSRATGYRFSEIGRYRTDRWEDDSSPHPHPHDARFAISFEGTPRIELLEVTGEGTHGASNLGPHHLAFLGVDDLESERARLGSLGFATNGANTDADGNLLLFFTEPVPELGVRIELVSNLPGPIVTDAGDPAPIDPESGRPSLLARG